MRNSYKILTDYGQLAEFDADFAQASSQIRLDGKSTPFQVADARHSVEEGARVLLAWMFSQGWLEEEVDEDDWWVESARSLEGGN